MKCNKFVYTICKDDVDHEHGHGIPLDRKLLEVLKYHKNVINRSSSTWDTYKKQTNLYELVFTTSNIVPSISSITPYSRSFFKHWEILSDFETEFAFKKTIQPLKCAFLAEGPGGFIEAFVKYRGTSKDTLYGITLISSDRMVPSWKFSRKFLSDNNITLLFGKDGDGSLYSLDNITSFVEEMGKNECDYVTADGGFDFSGDFNCQEKNSLLLVLCEIYTSLLLQKHGGTFVLKIYDISLSLTKKLLFILNQSYKSITFVKPHTSRPANSEKYVVCSSYLGADPEHLAALRECIYTRSHGPLANLCPTIEFVESVAMYNVVFVMKQIIYINLTLNHGRNNTSPWKTAHTQAEYELRWCHKYKLPIDLKSLHYIERK